MKLKDQVCSLELAKKLKELGVKQKSLFYWDTIGPDKLSLWKIGDVISWGCEESYDRPSPLAYSAFSCAELGEMLKAYKFAWVEYYAKPAFKESLPEWNNETQHWCAYKEGAGIAHAATEADA